MTEPQPPRRTPRHATRAPKKPPWEARAEAAWPWCLRLLGAGIIVWETVVDKAEKPSLLLVGVGLAIGRELVRFDRRRNGQDGK